MADDIKLTKEQQKLCHELTMETLRQNNALVLVSKTEAKEQNKQYRGYEEIGRSYFSVYEEFAYEVSKHWKVIEDFSE